MTKLLTKLITVLISAALILSSLSGNNINTIAQSSKNNQENSKKFKLTKVTQLESDLVEIKVDEKTKKTKKILKKPLTLGFTNSNNEAQLNKKQKEEILNSLKKWKNQMPFDNKFYVTGMLPAGDSWIVYMMSSVPNTNFDPSKEYTNEDFETNDLRFIDTAFTILLKNKKGNSWKAVISNDSQDIKEVSGFTEEELSQDAKNKLFGVDNPKNTFTETEEVLMETTSVSSAINSESTISSYLTLSSNNTIFSSSFTTNNTLTPSSISSNISSNSSFSSNVSNLNSLKSISFLDVLLGSIKLSAAESDYSWPWKAGETWNVNSGSNYQPRSGYVSNKWHAKVASEENETTNRGLDIMVPGSYWNSQNGNWNDIPVYAPKTGTITQLCTKNGTGGDNYFVRVDDMYIWHMTPQNFILNTSVKKGQQIGTVAIGSNRSGNIGQTGDYTTKCGSGIGAHLHIKFMLNNMNVDGTTMTWENDNYSSFTSQNSNNTTQNVLFRDANSGNNSIWKFSNTSHTGDTAFPSNTGTDWKVAGMGDFNADGYQDILWRNSNSGQNVLWEMQNGVISKDWGIISTVGIDFSVAGIGDFNGDGYADILWRNAGGTNVIWNYQRNVKTGDSGAFSTVPTDWKVVSVSDFNNDGKADIFWRNNNGSNVLWNMNNSSIIPTTNDGLEFVDNTWYVAGIADFNNDQKKDIFWRNNDGSNVIWNMNNRSKNTSTQFNTVNNTLIVGGLADFNQDGKADIFWRSQNGGQNIIWNMDNATLVTNTQVGSTGPSSTQIKGIFAK